MCLTECLLASATLATFQKAMNIIFAEMSNVITYIDDILIFTESESKHYQILEKVFSLLRKHQISINFEKCVFAQDEIEFLGHRINKCGITLVLTKIESYEDVKIKPKKQLQKILGFMNWFRPFIPNLSILSAPLYDKLKGNGNRIQWDQEDDVNLKDIFNKIREKRILHHPNHNGEFILRCIASDPEMGSILLQDDKIVGYYSKKYNAQELNYTTVEKEFLAILKSLIHFKHLIFNTKTIIETDNKNLTLTET
ncbi:Retrovirus-related Pol polyprotein from transposon 17.6 [Dictyocoela roeselum]|nr:Retrovirus-related Pol polyprotein from transposon 17.6 [Dictyocoela roeselum]